ncbi:MAG: hypothetical protein ACI8P3_003678 [Saprospiraceae bacterium]|jgi:hypothetical protein
MEKILKHSRLDDLSEIDISDIGTSLDELIGRWINTKEDTGQILETSITKDGDRFYIQIIAPCDPVPFDWGRTPIEIYYSGGKSKIVGGLSGHYDFGFMETDIVCMIKYGILVVMTYNRFKDDSGRSNYVLREFFHKFNN